MTKKIDKDKLDSLISQFIADCIVGTLKKQGFPFEQITVKKNKDMGIYKIQTLGDCNLERICESINAPSSLIDLVSRFYIDKISANQGGGFLVSYESSKRLNEDEQEMVTQSFHKVEPLLEATLSNLEIELNNFILKQSIIPNADPIDCIPSKLQNIYKDIKSFKDIESWRTKVQLANNCGKDSAQLGEWGEVRYIMVSLDSGAIIPIAMSDEHNKGYDLLHEFYDKRLIKREDFYPINYMGNNYIERKSQIPIALKAFTLWRNLGGNNGIVTGTTELHFEVTMDDFIKAKGKSKNIDEAKGELFPIGQRIISGLEAIHIAINAAREGKRFKEKKLFNAAYEVARELNESFYGDIGKAAEKAMAGILEAQGREDIKKLEELFFDHQGIKNLLHIKIKEVLKKEDKWAREAIARVFGDLDLALQELDRLFLTY
jgi:hypothetical protein